MKIVFMGTPEFAIPALKALADSNHEIIAVYTQPPRPSNRGMKLNLSQVHTLANELNIEVKTPINFKNINDVNEFKNLNADVTIVAAYGLLLPKSILEAFPFGAINIHPSKLPRFRGAAPLQRTVLEGDIETGVCIMQMDEGLDTGDILMQENVMIAKDITVTDLHDQLSILGAKLLLQTLDNLENIVPIKQSSKNATYAKKILKSEGQINFQTQDAAYIERMSRAFMPKPGVYFFLNDELIKIVKADYNIEDHKFALGEIINNNFHIACVNSILKPQIIQREGKKPQEIEEFIRGYRGILQGIIL